jgi:hypothetical protein
MLRALIKKKKNHRGIIGEMNKLKIPIEFELAQPTDTLTIFCVHKVWDFRRK